MHTLMVEKKNKEKYVQVDIFDLDTICIYK